MEKGTLQDILLLEEEYCTISILSNNSLIVND